MPKKTNIFTEAIMNVAEDFRALKDEAPKQAIPNIGEEQVSPKEFKARFQRMAPKQREQLMAKPGMRDQILKMIREQ